MSSLVVQAVARTSAGSGESQRSAVRNVRIRLPELAQVTGALLEVVADNFVTLDQRAPSLVEPVGEPDMEICPHRLGKRFVGGVPD